MKTTNQNNKVQGFIANPQVYLNEERGTLTHRLGDDLRIEMPINLYKKVLGLPFEKKETSEVSENSTRKTTFGLIAKPSIFLSKDGKYLIHSVLGTRITKHVNYYKRIFGAEFESTQVAQIQSA